MITYEGICKKLGFKLEEYRVEHSGVEDDSRKSPFSVLTLAELDFIEEYVMNMD